MFSPTFTSLEKHAPNLPSANFYMCMYQTNLKAKIFRKKGQKIAFTNFVASKAAKFLSKWYSSTTNPLAEELRCQWGRF